MLILEGPDGGGKTTLGKQLQGYVYTRPPEVLLSSTSGPSAGLAEWWESQVWSPVSSTDHLVYDRTTFISDPIYAPIWNRKLIRSAATVAHYLHVLKNRGNVRIIFCLPPLATILENNAKDKEPLKGTNKLKLELLWNLYWLRAFEMRESWGVHRIATWDYTLDAGLPWELKRRDDGTGS